MTISKPVTPLNNAHQDGLFFMQQSEKQFTKKALAIREQIEILLKRGLIIFDQDKVFRYLSTVSYYRLSAYFRSFQIKDDKDHHFKPGITFDQIWQTYVFDRELRLHISDALERIEIALRTALSNVMSIKYGNLWYISEKPFCKNWMSPNKRDGVSAQSRFKEEIHKICRNESEAFIRHYFNQYSYPQYPPGWMLMECLSFGKVTSLFRNLAKLEDKKAISHIFGYHPRVLESSLEPLRYMRNLCAHHARIWDRWFIYAPKYLHAFGNFISPIHSLHMQVFIIHKLNESISPDSEWKKRLHQLFEKYSDFIPFSLLGFSENWQTDPFWDV